MGLLSSFFGKSKRKETVKSMLEKGAVIIDVRSNSEFQSGHVTGSKNYPMQQISGRISELKDLNKPLILCCVSGIRSAQATSYLKKEGLDCINGGGWSSLNRLV
jgi:rhodanese-related sulfurtransferase